MDIYSARIAYLDELGDRRAAIINLLVTDSCFVKLLHPFRTMRYYSELARLERIDEHISYLDSRLNAAKDKVRTCSSGSVKHDQSLKEEKEISQEIEDFMENNEIGSMTRIKIKSKKRK